MGAGCTEAALRAVLAFLRGQPQRSVNSMQCLKNPQELFNFKPFPLHFAIPPHVSGACAREQAAAHEHIRALRWIFKAKIPFYWY